MIWQAISGHHGVQMLCEQVEANFNDSSIGGKRKGREYFRIYVFYYNSKFGAIHIKHPLFWDQTITCLSSAGNKSVL